MAMKYVSLDMTKALLKDARARDRWMRRARKANCLEARRVCVEAARERNGLLVHTLVVCRRES